MIHFRAFGSLELAGPDGRPLKQVLVQPKRLALLAFLACESPRGFHRRDRVLALLWPEMTEKRARAALNNSVYRLRQALGADALVSRGAAELGLDPDAVWCDVAAFEDALDDGRDDDALDLYRGDLLAGFHLDGVPDFERWLEQRRTELRGRATRAAWAGARAAEADGRFDEAAARARRATRLAPYDERLLQDRLELLRRIGDQAGTLHAYERFAKRLARELGVEPAPETRALVEDLPASAAPSSGTTPATASPATPDARPPAPPRAPEASEPSPGPEPAAAPAASAAAGPEAPAPGAGRHRHASRLLRPVPYLVVLALAVWGLTHAPSGGGHAENPSATFDVAVYPFAVRGAPELGYLGEGLMDMLSTGLDGAGPVRALDPSALAAAGRIGELPPDPLVARRLGADAMVTGAVTGVEGRIRISASLEPVAGGEPIAEATVEGAPQELFAMVDDLASRLLAGVAETRVDRLASVAARTTHSLPALRSYLDGERAFRAGRFVEAADAFRRAVETDTTFALAYYRLSLASVWADLQQTDPQRADAMALRYRNRLSPHDRRLVEGFAWWRLGQADSAEAFYRRAVAAHPEDVEAWQQLGETLFHYNPLRGRPITEAGPAFRRAGVLDPAAWGPRWHLALLDGMQGRTASMRQRLATLLELEPSQGRATEIRALLAFTGADSVQRRGALEPLRQADQLVVWNVAWRLATVLGDLDGAERAADMLTRPSRLWHARALGHELHAYLDAAHGRLRDARARADSIQAGPGPGDGLKLRTTLALLPHARAEPGTLDSLRRYWSHAGRREGVLPRDIHFMEGMLAAAEGLPDAGRLADSVAADGFPSMSAAIRAEAAWFRGEDSTALAILTRRPPGIWFGWAVTHPFPGHDLSRFRHAQLLEAAGRLRDALGWYAGFEENGIHDLMLAAPAHFRSAGIYERLGEPDQAARHYARVIQLWQDADPELQPVVSAARRALERLRQGR